MKSPSLLLLAALALLAGGASAQSADLVGVVDLPRALSELEEARAARQSLQAESSRRQAELDQLQGALRKDAEAFEKLRPTLSAAALEEKERDLRLRYLEVYQRFQQSTQQLAQLEQEALRPLLAKLQARIGAQADRDGLAVVLEKSEGMLYAAPEVDLTPTLLKEGSARVKRAPARVAVFDLQRALSLLTEGKALLARAKAAAQKRQAELGAEARQLREGWKGLRTGELGGKDRVDRETELTRLTFDHTQKTLKGAQEQRDQLHKEAAPLLDKLLPTLAALARRDDIAVVYEKGTGGWVLGPDGADLTDEVVAAFEGGGAAQASKGARRARPLATLAFADVAAFAGLGKDVPLTLEDRATLHALVRAQVQSVAAPSGFNVVLDKDAGVAFARAGRTLAPGNAQEELADVVAFVDLDRVVSQSTASAALWRKASAELAQREAETESASEALEAESTELMAKVERLETQGNDARFALSLQPEGTDVSHLVALAKSSETQLRALQPDVQKGQLARRWRELLERAKRERRELPERKRELLRPAYAEVEALVAAIARRDGISVVFLKNDALLHGDPALDLTDEVIRLHQTGTPVQGTARVQRPRARLASVDMQVALRDSRAGKEASERDQQLDRDRILPLGEERTKSRLDWLQGARFAWKEHRTYAEVHALRLQGEARVQRGMGPHLAAMAKRDQIGLVFAKDASGWIVGDGDVELTKELIARMDGNSPTVDPAAPLPLRVGVAGEATLAAVDTDASLDFIALRRRYTLVRPTVAASATRQGLQVVFDAAVGVVYAAPERRLEP